MTLRFFDSANGLKFLATTGFLFFPLASLSLPTFKDSITCQKGAEGAQYVQLSPLSGLMIKPNGTGKQYSLNESILRPFTSDGCSTSPDGLLIGKKAEVWLECCIHHDTRYWLGGTAEEKRRADEEFGSCIAKKGYPRVAKLYETAVRVMGTPNSWTIYRWGYGWTKQRPYSPLSEGEIEQVKEMYGVGPDEVHELVLKTDFPLLNMCQMFDPSLTGFNRSEELAYTLLQKVSTKAGTIEWARWVYFNHDERQLEVKLTTCNQPVMLGFTNSESFAYIISNSCGL